MPKSTDSYAAVVRHPAAFVAFLASVMKRGECGHTCSAKQLWARSGWNHKELHDAEQTNVLCDHMIKLQRISDIFVMSSVLHNHRGLLDEREALVYVIPYSIAWYGRTSGSSSC